MLFQILIASAFFQKLKKLAVFDASVFDNLPHAIRHITLRQGFQHIRIDQYHLRLIKSTYQVLAFRQIYGDFSTDGRIDLCQK